MGIDAASPDDVTTGWRQGDAPEAGEHGAGQKDRGADPGAEARIERLGLDALGVDAHGVGSDPLDHGAQVHQEFEHALHIPDAGDILEFAGPVGEQRGGEDGQGGVLVTSGADGALEGATAADLVSKWHGGTVPARSKASSTRGTCGWAPGVDV